jgi:hypothetical protein
MVPSSVPVSIDVGVSEIIGGDFFRLQKSQEWPLKLCLWLAQNLRHAGGTSHLASCVQSKLPRGALGAKLFVTLCLFTVESVVEYHKVTHIKTVSWC